MAAARIAYLSLLIAIALAAPARAADQDYIGTWWGYAADWKRAPELRDIGARVLRIDGVAADGSVTAGWNTAGNPLPPATGRIEAGTLRLTSAFGAEATLRLDPEGALKGLYEPPHGRTYVLMARARQVTIFDISLARAKPTTEFDGAWQGEAAADDAAACPPGRYALAVKTGVIAGTLALTPSGGAPRVSDVAGEVWPDANAFFALKPRGEGGREGLFHGRVEGQALTAIDPAKHPAGCLYRVTLHRG